MYYIGIDIGSTNAKVAIIDEQKNVLDTAVLRTGYNSKNSSHKLIDILINKGFDIKDSKIIATGYGRVSVEEAEKTITEITCHAKGAMHIFNQDNIVVIDIGGQDTKIIDVEDGMVKDFVMNDKCSAGTGRFLEVMAKTMDTEINNLVKLAKDGGGVTISSLCTVFAESEVISLIGRSEKLENIANAIVKSIVTKVGSQASKIDYKNKTVCLTGGLCEMQVLIDMLSDELHQKVISNEYGKFAGAIGAALSAC